MKIQLKFIRVKVEDERVKKISDQMQGNQNRSNEKQTQQLIVTSEPKQNRNVTETKIANTFNTNRTYFSEAFTKIGQ